MIYKLFEHNDCIGRDYVEPYAGGCGLALSLLFEGYVSKIHLNDVDRSIWAFWWSILNDEERFISKILSTPVTIEEWYKQNAIQANKDTETVFDLGFSTFFLNRTNRSGIIAKAGVIGGINQTGKYKIDCRYNAENLVKKIRRICTFRDQIHVSQLDAIEFLSLCKADLPASSFFYIDPPYYNKGATLYNNFYSHDDHVAVSRAIYSLERSWVLTYDDVETVAQLYAESNVCKYPLSYSVARKRRAFELMIFSDDLQVPEDLLDSTGNSAQNEGEVPHQLLRRS